MLQRIGGPSAVSLWAWLTLGPIAILGALFSFGPQATREHFWVLLAAAALSYLTSGPVFLVAHLTYLSPSKKRPARPLAALITFAVAGLTVGVTLSALVDSFDIGLETASGLGRAWLQLFWSSLIALVIDSRRRHRELSAELQDSLQQTAQLAKNQADVLANLRGSLITKLKTTLLSALQQTDAKGLNRLADEVIRPLRVELDRDLVPASPAAMQPSQIKWRPLLAISLRKPLNPWLTGLVAALSGLVASFSFFGFATIANFLGVWLFVALNLLLLRLFGLQNPLWSFPVLFAGSLFGAGFGEYLQQFAPVGASSLGNLNLGSWLIALFIGLQLSLESERKAKLMEMGAALERLRWQREKLDQVVWVETRRLSKFVHSEIQGRIRAAAIRSANLSANQLDQLRSECMAALERAREPVGFKEFLHQSQRLWEGILVISSDIQDPIIELLEQDAFAKAAAIEVIREGLCNAVRHGKAGSAVLTLRAPLIEGDGFLSVSIVNDGEPLEANTSVGFGSEVLDEASSQWTLANTASGVELVARIPLNLHVDSQQQPVGVPRLLLA